MVSGGAAPPSFDPSHNDTAVITRLIRGLHSEETREQSLDLLCKVITSAYRPLLSDSLKERAVTQVCNAIALLQSLASHPDTKMPFIRATLPVYLYPFLNTMSSERNYECLRLTSLGVIGSLAKVDDPEVIEYLLSTQIFPSCLRCMDFGRTLSKTVATFIIYRILLNEEGLKYCFTLAERYLSALGKPKDTTTIVKLHSVEVDGLQICQYPSSKLQKLHVLHRVLVKSQAE
ncbi:hypothetical protein F3Y22_tig00110462pilonHSYRG00322 [Hibiscus syriacus]|uniref:Cell differentiation protein RCD1-like protein n=1 Tax=Hibiscus syriacus TaxID=106335 RepID=A0A6A3AII8_HIBSY|nr:hypothetical protein F3Y22_tig00110462pilonHSYRG00322 [Hibiscus syriacus]